MRNSVWFPNLLLAEAFFESLGKVKAKMIDPKDNGYNVAWDEEKQ